MSRCSNANEVILDREALAYYKAIPREYDPTPELANFAI